MTNSFLATWGSDPMTTGADVREEAQAILNDFRQRLIDLINSKRPGHYTSETLQKLYHRATKHCPRLHQDVTLCRLYSELGRKNSGDTDSGPVVYYGIHAWIDAGMSPIIYFSGYPDEARVSSTMLERMYASGRFTPDRETLLGNLSVVQFSHFLADRVALHWMRYRWVCKLMNTIPELLEPMNWRNLCHGQIKVHSKVRKKQVLSKWPLKSFVPLLLIGIGQSVSLYRQAKNEFGLTEPLSMAYVARDAFATSNTVQGRAVLERFIDWEYGGWNTPQLDKVLSDYLHHYNFSTRHGYFELDERIWFQKAVETLAQPQCNVINWPAALYGNFLNKIHLSDEYEGLGKIRWKLLLKVVPELRVIQEYATQTKSPLISVLKGRLECPLLVHPILLAQFPASVKASYALEVAPFVARHTMKDMSYGVFERFETPQATERTLRRYDPDCVKQMSEWARQSKDIRKLNCRLQGHVSILWLMIRNLRGEDMKDQAIAWCIRLRSQRTKFEAMRLLGLTLEDVRLAPRLHDEFLSRDLGL